MKRILFVHNYYKFRGGEDSVLEAEMELLKKNGHEVLLYRESNQDISSFFSKICVALATTFSFQSYFRLKKTIKEFRADIVHVHNFFPRVSPSVFWAAKSCGVPVVMTVHNYRLLCLNGLLLRNGRACELCVGKSPWRGVFYGCYRESRLASLPVALMLILHRRLGTWRDKVDSFLCFTQFAREKMVRQSLPEEKIKVFPGFINLAPDVPAKPASSRNYALYLGRLSEEKGIRELVKNWVDIPYALKIVGDGPLKEEIEGVIRNNKNLSMDNRADRAAALSYFSGARVLIVPSLCFEGGIPMVVREAFAKGVPVLVSRIGGLPEVVHENVNGFTYSVLDKAELLAKLSKFFGDDIAWAELSRGATAAYSEIFSASFHLEAMERFYSSFTTGKK